MNNDEMGDEIQSCSSAVALADDFFNTRTHLNEDYLMPIFCELAIRCDGMINKPGIYALKLRVVKIK